MLIIKIAGSETSRNARASLKKKYCFFLFRRLSRPGTIPGRFEKDDFTVTFFMVRSFGAKTFLVCLFPCFLLGDLFVSLAHPRLALFP